jgi:beta-glucosidase
VLTVPGPARPGRRLVGRQVPAADFDDHEGAVLVDVSRRSGEAVTPAHPDRGARIVFRDARACAAGEATATFRVASQAPARIELYWSGALLGAADVPPTGGRYRWAEVAVRVTLPGGGGDLCLVLDGPVRLEAFRIDAAMSVS